MRNRYDFTDVFSMFESVFDEFEDVLNGCSNYRYVVPGTYPPVNVAMNEDKSISFDFALAGKKIEDVDLSFSGNYMNLKIAKYPKAGKSYLHKGISDAEIDMKLFLPAEKFDFQAVTAKMTNGLLSVNIPSKEVTKKDQGSTKVNIKTE